MALFLGTKPSHVDTPPVVKMRCPACRHTGAMQQVSGTRDISWSSNLGPSGKRFGLGLRECPNEDCRAVIFVEFEGHNVSNTYPPEVIDFDATNLPADIVSSLGEAIRAHAAGCYRASALMVRRVLEELCKDKSATGKDLKARIAALGTTLLVPMELLTAADHLRLLGNDAAHVEAKTYDDIGREEVDVAIDLTKELLKAAYQYGALLGRLQALGKQPHP